MLGKLKPHLLVIVVKVTVWDHWNAIGTSYNMDWLSYRFHFGGKTFLDQLLPLKYFDGSLFHSSLCSLEFDLTVADVVCACRCCDELSIIMLEYTITV